MNFNNENLMTYLAPAKMVMQVGCVKPKPLNRQQQHRIRAAGIIIKENALLLLRVKDFSGEYWIPADGGLEENDGIPKRV